MRISRRRMLALAALAGAAAARHGGAVPAPTGDLVGTPEFLLTTRATNLVELARERQLGILAISAANPGIDVWLPGPDRLVQLPTWHILPDAPRRGIVINKAELGLYHVRESGIDHYPIGVGREGFDTPLGTTTVVRKQANPTWYPTASTRADRPELPAVVPPGPDNPLGHRALYLGWPTYLIHGTNLPYGVGRRVSRGCIRMYPQGIERLFERVPVGTQVTVVAQPAKVGWDAGELYLQVHPAFEQLDELEERYSFEVGTEPVEGVEELVRGRAGDALERVDWQLVRAEAIARRGVPVRITRDVAAAAPPASAAARPLGGLY
jgi:L,D-transpeptidase ErfK/SrfK